MTAHAELGASVAHRWMPCPGSVRLSRGKPNPESIHSRTGTTAHKLGEMSLRRMVDPDTWLGTEIEGVEVDEEMVEAVRVYTKYCQHVIERTDGFREAGGVSQYWIEHKFSLAELNPPGPMFGTADFVWYDGAEHILHVVDYKHGSGVVVEVKNNRQLRYYALGAALTLGKDRPISAVYIWIIQPRANHPDGVTRYERVEYAELLAFAGELMDAARATLEADAPLHTGSHCRFCPALAECPAQREQTQQLAQTAFADMPLAVPPTPESLPAEVFWDIHSKLRILEDWSAAMRAEGLRRFERGEGEGSGMKMVAKRANRSWASEAQVEKWLREEKSLLDEEIYTRKLKSPAQIEKLVGKKQLPEEFVEKKSSGFTLAPLHDKRPAAAIAAGEVFEALNP